MTDMPEPTPQVEEDIAVDTGSIPISLLQKVAEAAQTFEVLQDELEDVLLSHDPAFLARMRQARRHHLKGQTRPLSAVKQALWFE